MLNRDAKYISPSYTRSYPLVVRRGYGAILEDVDGNTFLDFNAGVAVAALGHAHPEIVEVIEKQARDFVHISGTDYYYPQQTALAEKLVQVTPGDFAKKVHYGNSGAEAMEAALKAAIYATGRHKFIAFRGAFHGRTFGTLSLTASRAAQRMGFGPQALDEPTFLSQTRSAFHWSGVRAKASASVSPVTLNRQYSRPQFRHRTALPLLSSPCRVKADMSFRRQTSCPALRRICDEHGIVLIVDEVQSGMGRTGKLWAIEHFGVVPDIMCMAKAIGGGLPLGVTLAQEDADAMACRELTLRRSGVTQWLSPPG